MKFSTIIFSLLSTSLSLAQSQSDSNEQTSTIWVESSETSTYSWDANWYKDFPIHSSCNRTKFNQLQQAFKETKELAAHARDHTLRYGNESNFFIKYFGNSPSGEVVGWFANIVDQDKTGILFRCDDIDENCHQDGWAGHWRGENGSDETVICDLSFTSRKWLSQMCSEGYEVSTKKNTVYWASDLLHRIWHTTKLGQNVVGHYADTYDEVLELAESNPDEAVRNSATLRYYALDVYAYDIAVPGEGCSGDDDDDDEEHDDHDHDHSSESSSASGSQSATASTETGNGGSECHTHADGETHCV